MSTLAYRYIYLGLAQTSMFLQTFAEYPPSQTPDSWSVDKPAEQFLQQAEKVNRPFSGNDNQVSMVN